MPASPELRNAGGDVGIIEVFEEIEAEDLSESDCHIAVSREIEVDMQGIRNRIHPCEKHGFFVRGFERTDEFSEHICNKYLF